MSLLKKKALVLSRELAAKLNVRFSAPAASTLTVREGFDASGNPTINIDDGTPATTEQAIFIRILEVPSIGLNSIGLAQDSFGPHVVQIVTEGSAASITISRLTQLNQMRLLGEVFKTGARVEWYNSASGVIPVVGEITAAQLIYTFESLYHPLTDSI